MHFQEEFYHKFKFEESQVKDYFRSAKSSLEIAGKVDIPEVIFKFSYDALIKLGITLIAREGYKTRSTTGHHIKILEAMSRILKDEEIETVGNMMRRQRNMDLYNGGIIVTEKESREYLNFVRGVFRKV
ncbi:MAG: hypothetical protein ACD_50C00118G0002 [uncultured bacterium]|nr:MAG: hypothetical protein ACD_50C00118G0002 [uncultured bacterium]KKT02231.1 MAG: hypothetical protein UV80_C0005G0076 [Candidatus Peregrinibacteria bacterium GW2011_GWF2_43_17]KKT20185.1 MAG: hypothetical protein UW03_C0008G0010 [Candidatus Peregrinibacteria bacterium GW2011_GWA2_43_8]HAU40008.1 hypothetical protein [Candidatus Peregrinibacteria bacterium]